MWAVVGLGNPGIRYRWNRHNIGFYVIDLLSKGHGIKLKPDRIIPALTGKGIIGDGEVYLIKPTTYMNRSGVAVKGFCDLYGLSPQKVLVVYDDIDLPWNKIRIRKHGTSGGHKGVESIITELRTTNFPRLRLGIGRPPDFDKDIVEHVLGNFTEQEKKDLKSYCEKAVEAICTILEQDIDTAMNKFN